MVQGYLMHLSTPKKETHEAPKKEPYQTRFRDVLHLRSFLHQEQGFGGIVTAYKEKK